jgi:nucleoside-diphosphate-sugar epimerase
MRVFVAGGSGAIGRRLLPQLVERGHDVIATTRSPDRSDRLRALGVTPLVMDGLDAGSVGEAVARAEPEVIVHQMTALAGAGNPKRWEAEFARTNELRTRGLDHLMTAAEAVGVRRLVAQSYTGWPNDRTGAAVQSERDPLDADPPAAQRSSLAAIRYLEQVVTGSASLEGLALRYGSLYGPGTSMAGEYAVMIRKRKLPLVGNGAGVWSFIHVDDAAAATVTAVEHGAVGVYNIVDDDPAPVSEWLPYLAGQLGARTPRHVPVWLARLAVGEVGISIMTQIRGSSNAKAKAVLGWEPVWTSWRDGFRLAFDDRSPSQSSRAGRRATSAV